MCINKQASHREYTTIKFDNNPQAHLLFVSKIVGSLITPQPTITIALVLSVCPWQKSFTNDSVSTSTSLYCICVILEDYLDEPAP